MSNFRLESSILCCSHLGREIEILHRVCSSGQPVESIKVLLIAGMHGDEPEGLYLMDELINTQAFEDISEYVDLYFIPRLNPDGVEAQTRVNGRGVDLNRNFPNKDWSVVARAERYNPGPEPGSENETRGLMLWLEAKRPHFILNFHAWNPMVNFNGDCRDLAELMSSINECPVTSDMGYPTPGSAGTWFWEALGIPSITLEIQEGSSREVVQSSAHLVALVEVVNAASIKFIDS
jgi:murein peptide amidase A